MNPTVRAFIGEVLGTFIMCFFGIGAVATATLYNAHTGPFQVGMVWGIAIAIAIYCTRNLSCAHFNPAVSIAMCCARRLPWGKLPIYLIGQCVGAFVAALCVWALFGATVESMSGDELLAATTIWAEAYPNTELAVVTAPIGALAEGLGVMMLLIIIFSQTEDANVGKPGNVIWPLFVGFLITIAICTVGPLTDAGFNPARDIMPRIVASMFGLDGGWGDPGIWLVYVVGPIVGGIVGALIWMFILEPAHKRANKDALANKD